MKLLKDILFGLRLQEVLGSTRLAVDGVTCDSRAVRKDFLFVAIRGTASDGHEYIENAITAGARAVICEQVPEQVSEHVTYIQVPNSHQAYALLVANWHGRPAERMQVIGVTGTNGKTTTATLLHQLYTHRGVKAGLISTVRIVIHQKEIPATHTTPDAWILQKHLADMVEAGCKVVFMEVSSHGLIQHRVAGIPFAGAIFSNISRDHLDYHETMDAYVAAKKLLFDSLSNKAFAIVNSDDKHGETMLLDCAAKPMTYALRRVADIKVRVLESHLNGTLISINQRECWMQLIGEFNAYNAAAIYGAATALGMPADEALQGISALQSVDGRFQRVQGPKDLVGIVDYAHTPDALQNVLQTLQAFRQGSQRIITVLGCGGDRDKGKRPVMAQIAADLSDYVILTSDNPRSETPSDILRDMEAGLDPVQKRRCITIEDRAQGIKLACQHAHPGDIILVAGKGHEKYQDIQGVKHPFDDVAVLKSTLKDVHA
ncbi:MAG: UDP-N-acetylmuramoyl-L-alanyl-D-glutamate--2,6-diaminopimelate ligase [Schleiferiaceae bacterium]|nr:UDP-N-acetylmuramoyl-L-alanyl-D-glutamate--2,6-diaminopimelate ligase [Schleiferiaceae bacterium]